MLKIILALAACAITGVVLVVIVFNRSDAPHHPKAAQIQHSNSVVNQSLTNALTPASNAGEVPINPFPDVGGSEGKNK